MDARKRLAHRDADPGIDLLACLAVQRASIHVQHIFMYMCTCTYPYAYPSPHVCTHIHVHDTSTQTRAPVSERKAASVRSMPGVLTSD